MKCVGFYNQLGTYPAAVVPVCERRGERLAVFCRAKSKPKFYALRDGFRFEPVAAEFSLTFHERLFAFSRTRVIKYAVAREAVLFRWLLVADLLVEHPFLRLSFCEATSDRFCRLSELIQCTEEWLQQDPPTAKAWFHLERIKLFRDRSLVSNQASALHPAAERLLLGSTERKKGHSPSWMRPRLSGHVCEFTDEEYFKAIWISFRTLGYEEDVVQEILLEVSKREVGTVTEAEILGLLEREIARKATSDGLLELRGLHDPVFEKRTGGGDLPAMGVGDRDDEPMSMEQQSRF
jgi:hypothetical protein